MAHGTDFPFSVRLHLDWTCSFPSNFFIILCVLFAHVCIALARLGSTLLCFNLGQIHLTVHVLKIPFCTLEETVRVSWPLVYMLKGCCCGRLVVLWSGVWSVSIEEGNVRRGGVVILGIMEILKSRGLTSYCCLFCSQHFLGGRVWIYVFSSYSLICS